MSHIIQSAFPTSQQVVITAVDCFVGPFVRTITNTQTRRTQILSQCSVKLQLSSQKLSQILRRQNAFTGERRFKDEQAAQQEWCPRHRKTVWVAMLLLPLMRRKAAQRDVSVGLYPPQRNNYIKIEVSTSPTSFSQPRQVKNLSVATNFFFFF